MSTDEVVTYSASNIFKKKVAFDVLLDDTVNGVKNTSIDGPDFSLGGFPARLYLKKNEERLTLMMNMNAPPSLADGWTMNLEVTVATSAGWSVEKNFDDPSSIVLFELNSDSGITYLGLEFTLKVEDVFPYRLRFKGDSSDNRSDCKIILEGKKDNPVCVNKHILAAGSSYFNTLFFGEFKEKDQEVVKLGDVTEIDFLEYLYCVYTPSRPFAFKRLDTLLRLADRYQNDGMMWAIAQFLNEKTLKTSEEKRQTLCLAGAYKMPKIFEDTLKTMDKRDLMGLTDNDKLYFDFDHQSTNMLIKRLCEL